MPRTEDVRWSEPCYPATTSPEDSVQPRIASLCDLRNALLRNYMHTVHHKVHADPVPVKPQTRNPHSAFWCSRSYTSSRKPQAPPVLAPLLVFGVQVCKRELREVPADQGTAGYKQWRQADFSGCVLHGVTLGSVIIVIAITCDNTH